jgi:hypothetical protein
LNIIEALDHSALFASFFRGDTWQTWRVFLAALFALPMTAAERATYMHHTGRIDLPTVPSKEAALVVGRRGGKSRILATIAVFLAAFHDYTPHLAPGEVATVALIAADRRQARVMFRYILGLLRGVRPLAELIEAETSDTITLNNHVVIEIHTASFRVTRGYTFAAVLCDETAFWRSDESSTNPDTEIFRALRPGLSSIPSSMLLNASSPYRKSGVLYAAFARHFGKDNARVLVWRATSIEMNPRLDPAIIEEAYQDDPASAAAEYGAEFRDDINDFVPREVIDACTVRGRVELLPAAGVLYRAFVDPSGGTGDSMTLAVAHRQDAIGVLDCVREIRPPFSPQDVVAEFAALLRSYRVHEVVGDRYAGEWPREQFRGAGIAYRVSDQPKSDIYRDTLPLLNSGKVELLDVPRLVSQFCGLERRTSRGGKDSIDHGPGLHDDLANAASGALLLVQMRRGLVMNPAAAERFARLKPATMWRY